MPLRWGCPEGNPTTRGALNGRARLSCGTQGGSTGTAGWRGPNRPFSAWWPNAALALGCHNFAANLDKFDGSWQVPRPPSEVSPPQLFPGAPAAPPHNLYCPVSP